MTRALHHPVPGDHSECGPDCTVTGDKCCGGHTHGNCTTCDEETVACVACNAVVPINSTTPDTKGQAICSACSWDGNKDGEGE